MDIMNDCMKLLQCQYSTPCAQRHLSVACMQSLSKGMMACTEMAAVRLHASAIDIMNDCRKFERCEYSTPCSGVLIHERPACEIHACVRAQLVIRGRHPPWTW